MLSLTPITGAKAETFGARTAVLQHPATPVNFERAPDVCSDAAPAGPIHAHVSQPTADFHGLSSLYYINKC